MAARVVFYSCVLAACGGGGQSAGDAAATGDAATTTGAMSATLRQQDQTLIAYTAGVELELNGGLCACWGASMSDHRVTLSWFADRADTTGTFSTSEIFVIVKEGAHAASYQAQMGTVEVTLHEPGRIEGTFAAMPLVLTGSLTNNPPPTAIHIVEVSGGTFSCIGRSDGVYGMCWR